MRRAPCVAFFCDAFCRPRCSPRISFPPNSCGRPIPQQSEQLRFSCFGSRSQRFGMHSSKSRSQRFIIFIARPVDMLALISTHAWLHVAAARTRGCMPGRSTARDSCNPRPQWSSLGPRWTAATRASDRQLCTPGPRSTAALNHAPRACDGCLTTCLRWMAAPRARDRRSQRPPWSASARARDGQLQPGPAIYSSTRARDRRLHSAPAMDGCNPRPRSTHPAPAAGTLRMG